MKFNRLRILQRFIKWKEGVDQRLLQQNQIILELKQELNQKAQEQNQLILELTQKELKLTQKEKEQDQLILELTQKEREQNQEILALREYFEEYRNLSVAVFSSYARWRHVFPLSKRFLFAQRNNLLNILSIDRECGTSEFLSGMSGEAILDEVANDRIQKITIQHLDVNNQLSEIEELPYFLEEICRFPKETKQLLSVITTGKHFAGSYPCDSESKEAEQRFFSKGMELLKHEPDLIDYLAFGQSTYVPAHAGTLDGIPLPFGDTNTLPAAVPAQPKSHSVVFLHNSYYHFNTMAKALKDRGWDAVTVSVEPHDSPQRQFYFGEDINLYHDDYKIRQRQIKEFLATIPERFEAMHFTGQGQASIFAENYDSSENRTKIPWDFLELRRHRTIIGYSPSGCLDGVSQSAIKEISGNVCGSCVWEIRPDVCNDKRNLAWADTLDTVCDWIGLEGDWAVEYRTGPKFVRGPVMYTLDPDYWTPDLDVPEEMLIERKPEEILIYHAVGNQEIRRVNGRDIKGSGAVVAAVEKLQSEGLPVKLLFLSKQPITKIRYYKVQADIVVDQLNYGRLGANARECLMLGKPLVTRLLPKQQAPLPPLAMVEEVPALDASEQTIEKVLRELVLDPDKRKQMSAQSREFALRWIAADVCAHRFEVIIDRLKKGMTPETDGIFPSTKVSSL